MIVQNFDMMKDDPAYTLKIKDTLTIKPRDFNVRVAVRGDKRALKLFKTLVPDKPVPTDQTLVGRVAPSALSHGKPITIYYGSNTGTCEALAHHLASRSVEMGFAPRQIVAMNAARDALPRFEPTIFIAATYDGQPSDDAVEFMTWLEADKSKDLSGVQYAVFGCGTLTSFFYSTIS